MGRPFQKVQQVRNDGKFCEVLSFEPEGKTKENKSGPDKTKARLGQRNSFRLITNVANGK